MQYWEFGEVTYAEVKAETVHRYDLTGFGLEKEEFLSVVLKAEVLVSQMRGRSELISAYQPHGQWARQGRII